MPVKITKGGSRGARPVWSYWAQRFWGAAAGVTTMKSNGRQEVKGAPDSGVAEGAIEI